MWDVVFDELTSWLALAVLGWRYSGATAGWQLEDFFWPFPFCRSDAFEKWQSRHLTCKFDQTWLFSSSSGNSLRILQYVFLFLFFLRYKCLSGPDVQMHAIIRILVIRKKRYQSKMWLFVHYQYVGYQLEWHGINVQFRNKINTSSNKGFYTIK